MENRIKSYYPKDEYLIQKTNILPKEQKEMRVAGISHNKKIPTLVA